MYDRLVKVRTDIARDGAIKAFILRGAGDKAFVSGTDIYQFRGFKEPKDSIEYEARMDRVFDALEDVPVLFISGRRRHTSCSRDWSSDVCSSDLRPCKPRRQG